MEVDRPAEIVISGGKEGTVLLLKIEEEGLVTFARVDLGRTEEPSLMEEKSELLTLPVERQIQSLSYANSENNEL